MGTTVADLVAFLGLNATSFISSTKQAAQESQNLERTVKSASGAVSSHGEAAHTTAGHTDTLSKSTHSAGESAHESEGMFGHLKETIKELAAPVLAAGAAFGAAFALKEAISETITLGDQVRKLSRETGLSSEASSVLKFQAQETGVSFERMEVGVSKFERALAGITDLEDGVAIPVGKGMITVLDGLGVKAMDATGKALPFDDVLGQLSEKFKDMPNGAEKTALATQLFGRAGRELIPMLNQGKEGLAELKDEAYKFGVVLDEKTLAALYEQKKAMREFHAALEGVSISIGTMLTPLLTWMAERGKDLAVAFNQHVIPALRIVGAYLTTELGPYFQQAGDQVEEWAGELKEKLPDALAYTLEFLANFVDGVVVGIDTVTGGVSMLVNGFAAGMSAIVDTVTTAAKAVYEAFSYLNPFAEHSPSLVSQVEDGAAVIGTAFGTMSQAGAQLDAVTPHIHALSDTLTRLGASAKDVKLDEAFSKIAGKGAAEDLRAAQQGVEDLKTTYEHLGTQIKDVEGTVKDWKSQLDEAKQAYNEFKGATLAEQKPFDAESKALDEQMTKIKLKVNEAKQSGPLTTTGWTAKDGKMSQTTVDTAAGRQVKDLEAQLASLQLKAESVQLKEKLAIDPLKDKIKELTDTTKVLTFKEIIDGLQSSKTQMDDAQIGYDTANSQLATLKGSYQSVGDTMKAYEQVVKDAKDQVAGLGSAAGKVDMSSFKKDMDKDNPDGAMGKMHASMEDMKKKFSDAEDSAHHLKEALGDLWDRIKPVVEYLKEIYEWLTKHPEVLYAVVAALAAYKIALIAVAVWQGVVAATNPFVWVAIAIAALVFLGIEVYKHREEIWKALVELKDFLVGIFEPIGAVIAQPFKDAYNDIVTVKDGIVSAFWGMVGGVTGAFSALWGWLNDNGEKMWSGLVRGVQWAKDVVQNVINAVIWGLNAGIDGINWLIKKYDSLAGLIPGVNLTIGEIGHIPYVKFAQGGITTGEMMARIGDNMSGREAVIPLDNFNRPTAGAGLLGNTSTTNDRGITIENVTIHEASQTGQAVRDLAFYLNDAFRAEGAA